ncbi:hypothetical protein K0U00_50740, partial [Paenibacillus sepulcri]|nr:hypothetical protein [Paenibacillus sepulcri]
VDGTGLSGLSAEELKGYGSWVRDPRTSFWMAGPTSVRLIKKIPAYSANPTGLLIFSVPAYEVNKLISSDTKLGKVLVMDEERHVISGNDGGLPDNQLEEPPLGG